MMRTKVKTDYISILNDDMYVLPFGTRFSMTNRKTVWQLFLSFSYINTTTYTKRINILANYGDSIETFQEDKLLKEYMNYKINDWMGATILQYRTPGTFGI